MPERFTRQLHTYPIKREMLDPDQQARGQRLLSFLRQSFAGYSKAEGIIAHYVATNREGEAHGFEAIRLINREFSIQSRAEALGFRSSLFSLAVKEERLLDAVRAVETQLHQFEVLLRSASGGGVTDAWPSMKLIRYLFSCATCQRKFVPMFSYMDGRPRLRSSRILY